MTVEYHPAVEAELEEIRNFYDGRRPRLGREFIDEFERLVLRMTAAPGRWMVVEADIRRALMRRFPYVIFQAGWPGADSHHGRKTPAKTSGLRT